MIKFILIRQSEFHMAEFVGKQERVEQYRYNSGYGHCQNHHSHQCGKDWKPHESVEKKTNKSFGEKSNHVEKIDRR